MSVCSVWSSVWIRTDELIVCVCVLLFGLPVKMALINGPLEHHTLIVVELVLTDPSCMCAMLYWCSSVNQALMLSDWGLKLSRVGVCVCGGGNLMWVDVERMGICVFELLQG